MLAISLYFRLDRLQGLKNLNLRCFICGHEDIYLFHGKILSVTCLTCGRVSTGIETGDKILMFKKKEPGLSAQQVEEARRCKEEVSC